MKPLLIRGGTLVNHDNTVDADIIINRHGKIAEIGEDLYLENASVIDAREKYVLPGGIDVHVHLPWPTGAYISSDDFGSGTRAAMFGGTTTIIDYVIPDEQESLLSALNRKQEKALDNAWVDYSFHINIRGDVDQKIPGIPELVALGLPSFKIFLAYEGFRLSDQAILQTMQAVHKAGGILVVHAENGPLADYLTGEFAKMDKLALKYYSQTRPALCEFEAIQRILAYAQAIGTRVHFHHVSTELGADAINTAREKGLPVTGETCPHYLVFSDEDYLGDLSKAASLVCAPSIKTNNDRQALWKALQEGSLSMVATDHCPYTKDQKESHLNDFRKVPGGMAGVETRLPILFTEGVIKKRLSLERFVEVWSTEPAKVFGLYPQKGSLAVGSDGDLVIINPHKKSVLSSEITHMNTDCLPYEGKEVYGYPVTTILRGTPVVVAGEQADDNPRGQLLHRDV